MLMFLSFRNINILPPFEAKIKETFFLENASNLTHEFFYDNFSKKYLLGCLIKIVSLKKTLI